MAVIVLIFGWPDNGKTTLATSLEADHGFHRVDVDAVYVQFIRAHYPLQCPANIEQVILQHYDHGFGQDVARRRRWHKHLLGVIVAAARQQPKVVVDGYLLHDCRTAIDDTLTGRRHHVKHIRAEWHTYTEVGPGLTVKEVAALGDT